MNDTATTFEDKEVIIRVLDNDTDPDTPRANLRVSVLIQPLNGRARVESDRTITYTPNANFAGENSFTYRLSDGSHRDDGSVTVTVVAVNDAPTFPSTPAARSVPERAKAGANVGAPVTATDIDNAMLTYRLSGADASSFDIDSDGQITVGMGVTFDAATKDEYAVTVTADDRQGETAMVEVTITVTAGPTRPPPPIIIITGGGGGGGGPSGPSPSEVDFEWNVTRDIEELDGGNDWPTGLWSDGETLWIAENGQGADDEVYAYDRASGERLSEREFTLAETNRAPRGFWSDGETVWVSDSGQERLFAYDLATGERLEEREFALAAGNSDARGIWSDEETMWVLDGRADALFAYALASGELLAEYALDAANRRPPRHLVRRRDRVGLRPRGEAALRLPPARARGARGRRRGTAGPRARPRRGVPQDGAEPGQQQQPARSLVGRRRDVRRRRERRQASTATTCPTRSTRGWPRSR